MRRRPTALLATVFALVVAWGLVAPATASFDTRTVAVEQGIGYRSNLLDPVNTHGASGRLMLAQLLQRLGLLPTWMDHSRQRRHRWPDALSPSANDFVDYFAQLRLLISAGGLEPYLTPPLPQPRWYYDFDACSTNRYPTALTLMRSVVAALGRGPAADELIMARHTLLRLCEFRGPEAEAFVAEALAPLAAGPESGRQGPWRDYLSGAAAFYLGDHAAVTAHFARIPDTTEPWLSETARYMDVRIAKTGAERPNAKVPWSVLDAKIAQHLARYPDSRYTATIAGLKRLVLAETGGSDAEMGASLLRSFADVFRPGTTADVRVRLSLLDEFASHFGDTGQGRHRRMIRLRDVEGGPPISDVMRLLEAVAVHGPRLDPDQLGPEPGKAFDDGGFTGLGAYHGLLRRFAVGDFATVADANVDARTYGALAPDAVLLRARALERLGRHWDAAQVWIALSRRTPVVNGLTEAAAHAVRGGRFDDFARLDWRWAADVSTDVEVNPWVADEFLIDPVVFLAHFKPIRRLLRRGSTVFMDAEQARGLYDDPTVDPVVRFWALEPELRTALLQGKWSRFVVLAEPFYQQVPHFRGSPLAADEDRALFDTYRDLVPFVRTLRQDADDADALRATGYFLSSMHLFPRCGASGRPHGTLWEHNLGDCAADDAAGEPAVPPIELLMRALDSYRKLPERRSGEARTLRILIFCFENSVNRGLCVRDSDDVFPRALRRGWFERLHRHFPEAAAKTPHWF